MRPEVRDGVAAVAARPRLLVATDFDGVLAPFVLDPLDARPQAGTIEAITTLTAAPDTWTAVVSGRDLATLAELSGLGGSGTTLIGSHGAETNRARQGPTDQAAEARLTALRAWVEPAVATRDPRIRLEHKPTALVLHTRGLPEDAVGTATDIAAEAARMSGVSLLSGKGVHELSVVAADKGTAVQALAGDLRVDAVVYLGDDVTDEHVFTVLGPRDLTIKVGPGETAARTRLDDCTEVPAVLDALAAARTA
ncbi:trehalose-phosphatase [Janibacter sp. DB-40]|uniref:trehalose-phosphatase n=1 Tax=Janibacter sp. DB-40 TaxID=3028808 RepID=UPI002406945E|nr:trehalose-phosphatase [Janibacter sp. DB-40]